jgi:hypothetical protein
MRDDSSAINTVLLLTDTLSTSMDNATAVHFIPDQYEVIHVPIPLVMPRGRFNLTFTTDVRPTLVVSGLCTFLQLVSLEFLFVSPNLNNPVMLFAIVH